MRNRLIAALVAVAVVGALPFCVPVVDGATAAARYIGPHPGPVLLLTLLAGLMPIVGAALAQAGWGRLVLAVGLLAMAIRHTVPLIITLSPDTKLQQNAFDWLVSGLLLGATLMVAREVPKRYRVATTALWAAGLCGSLLAGTLIGKLQGLTGGVPWLVWLAALAAGPAWWLGRGQRAGSPARPGAGAYLRWLALLVLLIGLVPRALTPEVDMGGVVLWAIGGLAVVAVAVSAGLRLAVPALVLVTVLGLVFVQNALRGTAVVAVASREALLGWAGLAAAVAAALGVVALGVVAVWFGGRSGAQAGSRAGARRRMVLLGLVFGGLGLTAAGTLAQGFGGTSPLSRVGFFVAAAGAGWVLGVAVGAAGRATAVLAMPLFVLATVVARSLDYYLTRVAVPGADAATVTTAADMAAADRAWAVAATVILVIGAGLWFLLRRPAARR